jgi:hypothetical protein
MNDYLKMAQTARERYKERPPISIPLPPAPAVNRLTLEIEKPKAKLSALITSTPTHPPGAPTWEDHLADLLDLSRPPRLPCEECGGSNFAKGKVRGWREQWLCRDCVKGLCRAEVETLRIEREAREAEPGYWENDDPILAYPEDRAELITLLRESGCELWMPPKGGLVWRWPNMPPEGPALMERRKADLIDELQAEAEAFEYLRVHNTAIDAQVQERKGNR